MILVPLDKWKSLSMSFFFLSTLVSLSLLYQKSTVEELGLMKIILIWKRKLEIYVVIYLNDLIFLCGSLDTCWMYHFYLVRFTWLNTSTFLPHSSIWQHRFSSALLSLWDLYVEGKGRTAYQQINLRTAVEVEVEFCGTVGEFRLKMSTIVFLFM